jgi:hypothetical protein
MRTIVFSSTLCTVPPSLLFEDWKTCLNSLPAGPFREPLVPGFHTGPRINKISSTGGVQATGHDDVRKICEGNFLQQLVRTLEAFASLVTYGSCQVGLLRKDLLVHVQLGGQSSHASIVDIHVRFLTNASVNLGVSSTRWRRSRQTRHSTL